MLSHLIVFSLVVAAVATDAMATSYTTPEARAHEEAKIASWDGLDGTWTGSAGSPDNPKIRWSVMVVVVGPNVRVQLHPISGQPPVQFGSVEPSLRYQKRGLAVRFVINGGPFPGRYEVVLIRQEKHELTAIIERWHPKISGQLQELSFVSGPLLRQPFKAHSPTR